MRKVLIIVLAFISLTAYGQRKQTIKELVVTDTMTIKAGNPATNKIAVSVDGNGKIRWQYLSDFQDSINTGVYDTVNANVVVTQAIRVTGSSFASDTLASIGTGGTVTRCFATCDTIQYIIDNLGDYSPWDTTATAIVQKDTTLNVGIGTTTPSAKLHIEGSILINDNNIDGFINSTLISGADLYTNESGEFNSGLVIKGVDVNSTNIKGYTGVTVNNDVEALEVSMVVKDTTELDGFEEYIYVRKDAIQLKVTDGTNISTISIGPQTIGLASNAITILNGSQANGYILTSDASALATWTAPPIYTGDTVVTGVTTGGSFAAPDAIGGIVFSGTGTQATYTLTLPTNPTEGQKVLLTMDGVAITTLSFNAGVNTLSATLTLGVPMLVTGQRWVTFKGGTWY